ncbi:MAG: hypothetical protein ACT4O0_01500 [Pseudonocardia sp.]
MSNRTAALKSLPQPVEPPRCTAGHRWCWGSCTYEGPGPVEHRMVYRIVEPADQLGEERSARRKSVATGMAQRGDGPPLIHLSVQTARRELDVRLTFPEVLQLQADLSVFLQALADNDPRRLLRVQCSDCGHQFHPDALAGPGMPCRDCGGQVHDVNTDDGAR